MENLSETTVRRWEVAVTKVPPRTLKEGRETKEGEETKESEMAKEGGETKEHGKAEECEKPKEAEKAKGSQKTKEDEKATESEEAEEGAGANRSQKLLCARKRKKTTHWRINIDKCTAPGWLRTDSNATDHNAPFAFAKNTPEDNEGESDPTLSAERFNTLHGNNFVKLPKAFGAKMAAVQKLNKQINPHWEFAEPLLRVARREEELAYNAFLTTRAMAEARGWRGIVEDVDDVVQTPEKIQQA